MRLCSPFAGGSSVVPSPSTVERLTSRQPIAWLKLRAPRCGRGSPWCVIRLGRRPLGQARHQRRPGHDDGDEPTSWTAERTGISERGVGGRFPSVELVRRAEHAGVDSLPRLDATRPGRLHSPELQGTPGHVGDC